MSGEVERIYVSVRVRRRGRPRARPDFEGLFGTVGEARTALSRFLLGSTTVGKVLESMVGRDRWGADLAHEGVRT